MTQPISRFNFISNIYGTPPAGQERPTSGFAKQLLDEYKNERVPKLIEEADMLRQQQQAELDAQNDSSYSDD